MVTFPPCKINLGLNVISKRPDGFHNIVTCFYPVPWTDVLEIVPAKDFAFSASGDPIPGAAADNLCVRAYEMFKKAFDLPPVEIHLHKVVPMGAGLGGGSSDGASALLMLNTIFDLSLSGEQLKEYAARLGSDCAFFIDSKPAIGTERGNVLSDTTVNLKGKYLVILKPEVQVSTAEAYDGVIPRNPASNLRDVLESHSIAEWRHLLKNDFEETLFKTFPVIEALQQKLYGFDAVYASMSGSGSAVYGIFERAVDLKKEFGDIDYWSGYLD